MMKRVAFITPNYTGATLPIVKELLRLGWHVDYFFPFGQESAKGNHSMEAMLLGNFHAKRGLHEIDNQLYKELNDYMGSRNFRIFYFRTIRPLKRIPVLRLFVKLFRRIEFIFILQFFKKQNYDFINLISNFDYDDFLVFHKNLDTKIITSFHEVCNHWNPDFSSPTPLLKYIFKHKKDIVVHSQNSYRDILKYRDVDESKIHHINFGIFETYKTIKGCIDVLLPEKYILFFGVFRQYKGLSCLLDAIKNHPDCLGDNKLVIAGAGYDDSIDEFKTLKNVHVINRYIKNEEVISLIEHSKFVVCPYTTMSQSGLPQTIYAFNKPIVASDLDGFREVIVDRKTGLLFRSNDYDALADAIRELSLNADLYSSMVKNIDNFESVNKTYSWPYITKQYLDICG